VGAQPYVSDPQAAWNTPYYPAGSIDRKVRRVKAAKNMKRWARFGRANGRAFNAKEFMRADPEWRFEKDYLLNRPPEPWTPFAFVR
jgi:hypothetical protein